jgi:SAM-dependent methyltransferase
VPDVEDALRRFYDVELAERESRPLGDGRQRHLEAFVDLCVREGRTRVVEVGCGAGRDGKPMAEAGLAYSGVDLSSTGVAICRRLGLDAVQASATGLPFPDDAFDAGWSMSTLMHLPGDGMERALAELGRVLVPGGLLEVGVWGKDVDGERFDSGGRYFRQRTDDDLRRLLGAVGEVLAFETWDHLDDDGAHYQWARVRVG